MNHEDHEEHSKDDVTESAAEEQPTPDATLDETAQDATEPPDVLPAFEEADRQVWDPATGSWRSAPAILEDEPSREFHGSPIAATRTAEPWTPFKSGLAGAVVGALVMGLLAFLVFPSGRSPVVVRENALPINGAKADDSAVVAIAKRARPWVVNIDTSSRSGGSGGGGEQGTGSGVILRSDGYILTNAHVVEGADKVSVTLATGEQMPASVRGIDLDTDVAVVKVDRSDMPSAVIGSAQNLQVGELAVAIGSPLGLSQTVTAGIISALGRTTESPNNRLLTDMIQTDAAVTQGNSGGALIDATGALVGINSSIAVSQQVGAEGIAFAIPIDIAKRIADELIATGKATHPYIGIRGVTVDKETADKLGGRAGARVSEVVPQGPADKAGIKPADVIVKVDNKKVDGMEELIAMIASRSVGESVPITFVRGGTEQTASVTLANRPADQ